MFQEFHMMRDSKMFGYGVIASIVLLLNAGHNQENNIAVNTTPSCCVHVEEVRTYIARTTKKLEEIPN
jgi:hypothetical protein